MKCPTAADGEGRIPFWNRGAGRIFGYDESEASSFPENCRLRHSTAYHNDNAHRRDAIRRDMLAVPAARKNGSRISIEF
jgi:hypothetical protein